VLAAVVIGSALYYALGPSGLVGGGVFTLPSFELHPGLPIPTLDFMKGLVPALKYLPIAIPFGLLTVVGGINTTESARVAGDDYKTRDILLTEAVATLIAGLTGGVAQSTPYIGQPAYKRMGARAGYTLLTGVVIGIGGMLGIVSFIIELIPRAVLAPILIFVALDIMVQSFHACPPRHAWAVGFAFFPTIARLLAIKLGNPELVAPETFQKLLTLPGKALPDVLVTVALGNGFIVTAMLWGAFLAEMIDKRLRHSAAYLLILAVLAFFGVIHSASPDGVMYFPWQLDAFMRQVPYQFAAAYLALALLLLLLSLTRDSRPSVSDSV
jgi:AGZA family xanthine/uracil permease-like MFS transporter